jgi:hypothetical protein
LEILIEGGALLISWGMNAEMTTLRLVLRVCVDKFGRVGMKVKWSRPINPRKVARKSSLLTA